MRGSGAGVALARRLREAILGLRIFVLKGKSGVRRRFLIAGVAFPKHGRLPVLKLQMQTLVVHSGFDDASAHDAPLSLLDFVDVAVGIAH